MYHGFKEPGVRDLSDKLDVELLSLVNVICYLYLNMTNMIYVVRQHVKSSYSQWTSRQVLSIH